MLEADTALDKVDRYGRLLRYVRDGGVNVNLELVRRGAATPYFYKRDWGTLRLTASGGSALRQSSEARPVGSLPRHQARPLRTRNDRDERPARTGRQVRPELRRRLRSPVPARPRLCRPLTAFGIPLPVRVVGEDPHHLDGDGDGLACE